MIFLPKILLSIVDTIARTYQGAVVTFQMLDNRGNIAASAAIQQQVDNIAASPANFAVVTVSLIGRSAVYKE